MPLFHHRWQESFFFKLWWRKRTFRWSRSKGRRWRWGWSPPCSWPAHHCCCSVGHLRCWCWWWASWWCSSIGESWATPLGKEFCDKRMFYVGWCVTPMVSEKDFHSRCSVDATFRKVWLCVQTNCQLFSKWLPGWWSSIPFWNKSWNQIGTE